jgi:hypothetical protein
MVSNSILGIRCIFLEGEMKYGDWPPLENAHGHPFSSENHKAVENLMTWNDVHSVLLKRIVGYRRECAIATTFWLK